MFRKLVSQRKVKSIVAKALELADENAALDMLTEIENR
jgi:hypothetical protein